MASTRNWTLEGILNQGLNFQAVDRVSVISDTLSQTIQDYESKGIPLVIEDFHKDPKWPQHMFTLDQFIAGTSPDIHVRNIHNCTDSTLPVEDFIAKCRLSSVYRVPDETVRFYGKDAECPKAWETWLQKGGVVPEILLSKGKEDLFRFRPDNPEATIETLMCYLGIGDTFTPCHKDLCASTGQNLMCYTERDGSSFWFMTESSSAQAVAEYFRHKLKQELDNENHIATIEELTNAPFKVYVLQQRLGDMVLVPPRSCHQVMNSGGITVKTSWSRMTLKGLSTAYHYELPIYRRVCRPETYRIKSTIHHVLVSLTNELEISLNEQASEPKPHELDSDESDCITLVDDLKVLLSLYDHILAEEYEDDSVIQNQVMYKSDTFNDDIRLVCDFCSGDIFQSFFECRRCCDADDGPCQLCPGCYVEGRNCKCGEMQPMQYQDFQQLIDVRTKSVNLIQTHQTRYNRGYEQPLTLGKLRTDTAALFQAACILYRSRRDINPKRATKICRWKEQTHEAKLFWLLYCKKCHRGRCFSHILTQYNMHSAEALLHYASDESHDKYHQQLIDAKPKFEKEIGTLRDDRKKGTPPRGSGYHLLVDNAKKYKRHSRPWNAKYMESGWYDTSLRLAVTAKTEKSRISPPPSSSPFSVQEALNVTMSSVNTTFSDPTCNNETVFSKPQPSKKRKQLFVDVPTAPYNIRRDCGEESDPNKGISANINRTAKAPNQSDNHQLPLNAKFGPPIGVVKASTKATSMDWLPEKVVDALKPVESLVSGPLSNAPIPSSSNVPVMTFYQLPAQGGEEIRDPSSISLQGRFFQTHEFPIASQHHTHSLNHHFFSTDDATLFPWTIDSCVIPHPFHANEAPSKKRKREHQSSDSSDDEAETVNTSTQSDPIKSEATTIKPDLFLSHSESDEIRDTKQREFDSNEASASTQQTRKGHVPSWYRAYYPTVSDIQVESVSPMTKWRTAAPDTSQVTLSSLQLQTDSPTSIILGTWKVNASMVKDENVADELYLFKDLTQSPMDSAFQSPLLTNRANYSTFPDGEELDDIWGQPMLSPTSMFEVNDINFDNNMSF